MKNILALLVVLTSVCTLAQRPHEFQARIGFGVAVYASDYEMTYLGIPLQHTQDGAATAHTPIELRYEFAERFNAGIDLKFGSYLYDPDDSLNSKSNNFSVIGIAGEFAVANKENFRWYVGLGFNTCTLQLNESADNNSWRQVQIWKGPGFRMNTGIIKYFGDGPIGFNANMGYDSHNFKLEEMTINDTSSDLTDIDAILKVSGVDITLGLVLRIK